MDKVDVAVIGAGVVGLAIANYLSNKNNSVFLLERNETYGRETSSRNSEVIHAGIYYPNDSLKGSLCCRGNVLLFELCHKYKIPHNQIGKIIFAANQDQDASLPALLKKALGNGARGLELISQAKVKSLEPNIKTLGALYSTFTGIIDVHALMKLLAFLGKENGVEFCPGSKVTAIEKTKEGYVITCGEKEPFVFLAQKVVNSAGLESDSIAAIAGFDLDKSNYRLKYCKGHYFRVASAKKAALVSRLVYPVPDEHAAGLGVHVTKDLGGGLRLGPDTLYVDRFNYDFEVPLARQASFFSAAREFLPFLNQEDLIPDTSGMRPKLQGEGEPFRDFVINEETAKGFSGFVNLIGIESPGLTACLAIAEKVSTLLR